MKHILYTVKEGGNFRFIRGSNDNATVGSFNKLKEDGYIAIKTGDFTPPKEKIYFMVLAEELDNYDFILKRKR